MATHFHNASGFETNPSHTKHVTSYTWLREVTEPAVPLVTYGTNPVKIGGSVAESHFTSSLHFKWSFGPTLDEEVLS